jgi:adenylate cyclase class 2
MQMAAKQEVEIKFRIPAIEALTSTLKSAGFHPVTPRTHEMNTAYDWPGRDLRSRGCILRLRQYGDRWTLTYKEKGPGNGRHKSRPEIETELQNGPAMAQILKALGFQPVFSYEKFRSEWSDGKGHVVLDETPIGTFGEIEGEPDWIDQVARELGLTEHEYIKASYSELFQDWKRKTGSTASDMLFSK